MKFNEVCALIFVIVVFVFGLILIGVIVGSSWQEREDNKRLNKLGYRLVYHYYKCDNVSTNWYELKEIKDGYPTTYFHETEYVKRNWFMN